MIELSFVIPAYNVEKYVERCLDSIYSQGIDQSMFEVIVVDDGSTDGTRSVLDHFQEKHKDLRIISQVNQGVSAARNHGMSFAQGQYLWFVDADDYIVEGALNRLLTIINKDNIDVLFFNCQEEYPDGKRKVSQQPVEKNRIITGEMALNEGFYPASSCCALWKKDYLIKENVVFCKGLPYAEDSLFVFSAILPATALMFMEDVLYIYSFRDGSATTTKLEGKKILLTKMSDVRVIEKIKELSLNYRDVNPALSILAQKQYNKILFGLVYSLFRNKQWRKYEVQDTVIAKLKENQLYPLKGPFYSWKKWMMSRLLNIESLIR